MLLRTALILLVLSYHLQSQSTAGTPVVVDGMTVVRLYAQIGQLTARDRAMLAERRLGEVAADRQIDAQNIQLKERPDSTEIYAGNTFLFSITEADAQAAGRARVDVARDSLERVRSAVVQYRETRTWRNLVRGSIYAAVVTFLLIGAVTLLNRLYRSIRRRIFELRRLDRGAVRFHKAELLSASRSASIALTAASLLRWLVFLLLLEIYLPLVLGFFPGTAGYSVQITGWILEPLRYVWQGFLDFLPNLFFILVISGVTYGLIRVSDFIFREIGAGRISIEGFYADWAQPTSRLLRVCFVVLGTVVIFPYLPGSKSPAFQGISIFLGVLLSLGSTSAVAHAVAGTILTYMRPFQLGDRVRISDVVGDVVEKNLLVTRIQTIKNEIITIPNANILNGQMWNFSTSARENNLILHTTVTIGYDSPWRTVHELLISAALSTQGIQEQPRPFVLQTALNDFYVSYELNAYTSDACRMVQIYSSLHQNIQDRFNEAGVEIMSPHYSQIRDGNAVTIPESYRPSGYQAPGIRVQNVPTSANARHS